VNRTLLMIVAFGLQPTRCNDLQLQENRLTRPRRLVKAQSSMLWWRRCLVVVPVISFVTAAFLWSCGGGGSSSTPTPTPPVALRSVVICEGTPFSPTPTPVPTTTKTPTPTPKPTPKCSPVFATSLPSPVALPTTLYFNAQGTFASTSTSPRTFRDVTNSSGTAWFVTGDLAPVANGIYSVPLPNGCGAISVEDGGFASQTVQVTIGSPKPPATPCPTPTPSPTP
jgi:hypothetical protein